MHPDQVSPTHPGALGRALTQSHPPTRVRQDAP